MIYLVLLVSTVVCTVEGEGPYRHARSPAISNLSEETSNVLGDLANAINPMYIVGLGVLIAAGCAFQLAYGSRKPTVGITHVASKNAPFSVRTA